MAGAKQKKDTEKAKVFDVAKPGVVAADPTSRPIIVGHGKTITQDPMMAPEEKTSEAVTPTEAPAPLEKKRELKLEPAKPEAADEQTLESTTEEQPAEEITDKTSEGTPNEEKKPEDSIVSSDAAAVDVLADSVSIKREQEAVLEKEEKKRQEVEKLIASKKYYVKTKTPTGQRNLQWLILLIVVVIAGAAYYLLLGPGKDLWAKSEPAPTPVQSTTVTQAPVPKPTTQAPVLAEFSNIDYGFSFKYPSEWGDVVVQDNSKIVSEKGKRVLLTFSKNKDVTAGMKSKDWSDSSKDVNADCKQPGFLVFILEKTDKDNGKTVLSEKADSQIYEELTGGLCNNVQVIANKKFVKNKTYTGLQIWHQAKVNDKFDLAQRIEDYKKTLDKYFTKQLRDQISAVIESAKEL